MTNSSTVYRVTFKEHFRHALPFLGVSLLLVLGFFYLSNKHGEESAVFFGKFIGFALLATTSAYGLVHGAYAIIAKGSTLTVSANGRAFEFSKGKRSISFSLSEIESLNLYESYNAANQSIYWYPWDGFSYAIVLLKNGTRICVTSLTVRDLKRVFRRTSLRGQKTVFPMPNAVSTF